MAEQSADDSGLSDDAADPVDASSNGLVVDQVPPELVRTMRSLAPETIDRITLHVQAEIAAYYGPVGGKRYHVIHDAVTQAVTHFLDLADKRSDSGDAVFELLRSLGSAEAQEGHSSDAMLAAHHVATRIARDEMRDVALNADLDPEVLSSLVDALFGYIEQLIEQMMVGHHADSSELAPNIQQSRRLLLTAMLTGQPERRFAGYYGAADWTPPEEVVLVVGIVSRSARDGDVPVLSDAFLSRTVNQVITVVASPGLHTEAIRAMAKAPMVLRIAVTWAVPIGQVRDAYRWACRALELAHKGIISAGRIVVCSQHRSALLLHSDPVLARAAGEGLLAPLMTQPRSRQVALGETLMVYLQSHASAPAMATMLFIHEQTVRQRMRKLHVLFGDEINNPKLTWRFLSALEIMLPIWQEQG